MGAGKRELNQKKSQLKDRSNIRTSVRVRSFGTHLWDDGGFAVFLCLFCFLQTPPHGSTNGWEQNKKRPNNVWLWNVGGTGRAVPIGLEKEIKFFLFIEVTCFSIFFAVTFFFSVFSIIPLSLVFWWILKNERVSCETRVEVSGGIWTNQSCLLCVGVPRCSFDRSYWKK